MWAEVYYNLHKHRLSIRNKGKVVAHREFAYLHNAKFAVQAAGR